MMPGDVLPSGVRVGLTWPMPKMAALPFRVTLLPFRSCRRILGYVSKYASRALGLQPVVFVQPCPGDSHEFLSFLNRWAKEHLDSRVVNDAATTQRSGYTSAERMRVGRDAYDTIRCGGGTLASAA